VKYQEFDSEIKRLCIRFGAKAFDAEYLKMLWRAFNNVSHGTFQKLVDTLIESRPHSRPPVMADFREANRKQTTPSPVDPLDMIQKENMNNELLLAQLKLLGVSSLAQAVREILLMDKESRAIWFELARKTSKTPVGEL